LNLKVGSLQISSGFEKQKLSLAIALIGQPRLIFLDEPTDGMDAESRSWIWEILKSFKEEGINVFFTTRNQDEAEKLADRVAVLAGGKLVVVGTPEYFNQRLGSNAQDTILNVCWW